MVTRIWHSMSERVSIIGGDVDDPDLRTQKTVLVVLSLSAIPLGITWTLIEFVDGDVLNGLITAVISSVILFNLLIYTFWKNFTWYRASQLATFLLFPVPLHFSTGGYTQSANIMWSLGAPLIALLSSRHRDGIPWFVAYLAIVGGLGVIDPIVFPETNLSIDKVFFDFSLNIINISIIVYLMLIYFVRRKNQAIALLDSEKENSQRLLLNILPKEIAPKLMAGTATIADRYEAASILFADIVGFTILTRQMAPEEMVNLLNQTFSHFDTLVERHDLEKIRTIGDNYMVASGVPRPRQDHAEAIANLALDMADYISSTSDENGKRLRFRIGINSGPVIAGVIGRHKFQYDIWGHAVNMASRMESQGVPDRIQVAAATHKLISDSFAFESRGAVDVKGGGEMNTWFLLGHRQN